MTDLIVGTSKTSDGSMYNRHDHNDKSVIKNRSVFLESLGIKLKQSSRVCVNFDGNNFCRYIEIDRSDFGLGMESESDKYADALITKDIGHALVLPIADCVGAVIFDKKNKVLMVSHLGRHSLEQNGAYKSVRYLVDKHASNPDDIEVWLSPAASKDNYPIWSMDNKGLKEVTFDQLEKAGIKPSSINDNESETDKDKDYFSFSEYQKGHRSEDGDHMIVAMMTS